MKHLLLACALALLGVAQASTNSAYTPYLGKWTCTRPAGFETGSLTVSLTGSTLDFTTTQTTRFPAPSPTHFWISQDPKTGTWTETSPDASFAETGTVQPNGAILFAGPAPEHRRFLLWSDGQRMNMLRYLDNTPRLSWANEVIACQR
jgi:hypothetical protein